MAVSSADGQMCLSAGVCGVVWNDANNNGIQDVGEPVIVGAVVTRSAYVTSSGVSVVLALTETNEFGYYEFPVPTGTYEIVVQIPPGMQPSPSNVESRDTVESSDTADSDGKVDGVGNVFALVTLDSNDILDFDSSTDFGFWVPPVAQPGTGTPGYWKNHPEAWPVETITVGGIVYTKAQAIAWLEAVGKDKTTTMFSSLVPAKLNLIIGNDGSCVTSTIAAADVWMATSGPVGSGVHAASLAWKLGEPLHRLLDNYNNGMLCAPHRN